MPSIEFSVDVRDIHFVMFEQLEIDKTLLKLEKFRDYEPEVLRTIVEEMAKFAVNAVAPTNRLGDQEGASFQQGQVRMPAAFAGVYQKMREQGLLGLSHSPEWGGQGFPELFGSLFLELCTGANTSLTLLPLLNHGASHLIEAFGTEEQKNTYCSKMYTGEWGGSMCLTEPQAGSDVGAASTIAEPHGDHYLIRGTKIFITNGEHNLTENIIHAVLARVPGQPKGTRGISLFIVPKYLVNADGSLGAHNDVRCERIEHKMGIKASPTCVMSFGDHGQCKGFLLGTLNQGMAQMFQMMNEARLGVGIQGLASASAAYLSALGYAQQRKQGSHYSRFKDANAPRTEIIFHPDVRRMLMTMKAYVEGLRILIYTAATYVDLSKYHPDPQQRAYHHALLELLTPICKSYGSDMGFKVCELAVQTFGGYGFTQEYPVEQYLRDVKIASIYEGTNGIQAMDLLSRKVSQQEGYRLKLLAELMTQKLAQWKTQPIAELAQAIQRALQEVQDVTVDLLGLMQSGQIQHGLLHALPYLNMLGNLVTAFYLTDAAVVAHQKLTALYQKHQLTNPDAQKAWLRTHADGAFYHGKIRTAEFFVRNILPQNMSLAASIKTHDESALDIVFMDEGELSNPLA